MPWFPHSFYDFSLRWAGDFYLRFKEQEILAVFSQRPLTELAPGRTSGLVGFWRNSEEEEYDEMLHVGYCYMI
jgi:hypothetical protein